MSEWSKKKWATLKRANGGRASDEAVNDLAGCAVELVSARGVTMTKEELADLERSARLSAIDTSEAFEHIRAQGARVATLEAELARLKPSGQVAEDVHSIKAVIWAAMVPPITVEQADAALSRLAAGAQEAEALRAKVAEEVDGAARAEVERLNAELALSENGRKRWKERALAAEARLAAIRERATSEDGRTKAYEGLSHPINVAMAVAQWVLEGDAPQEEAKVQEMPERSPYERWPHAERFPCGPNCTHDDATTPGHPERVKERSEAVNGLTLTATHEGLPGDVLISPSGSGNDGGGKAKDLHFERGAEAMRAACLWEVRNWAQRVGLGEYEMDMLKAVIEGAVP
jgi:hypothetical protein